MTLALWTRMFGADRMVRTASRSGTAMLRFAGTTGPVAFLKAADVEADIRALLPTWPCETAGGNAPAVTVERVRGHFIVTSEWLDEPLVAQTSVSAACAAIIEIAKSWLARSGAPACLHCAAFEVDGRLVLIAGTNRSGKSTLAARLCAAGLRLYCDDMLPLTEDRRGVALGVPPRLRLPLPASSTYTLARYRAAHPGPSDERYAYLRPPTLVPHGETAPLGAMILLDRRPSGPAGFAAVGAAEALRHLHLRNLHQGRGAEAMTDELLALMRTLICVRLVYSDLDEAAESIASAFAAWPPADTIALRPAPPDEASADPRQPTERQPLPPGAYRRAAGIGVRAVDQDLFLVDTREQAVLQLNAMASAIWTLLEDPLSFDEVVDLLDQAFPQVARARIAADVLDLFHDLLHHRLIAPVSGGQGGQRAADPVDDELF